PQSAASTGAHRLQQWFVSSSDRVRIAALIADSVIERNRNLVRRDFEQIETDERLRRERRRKHRGRLVLLMTLSHDVGMRAVAGDEINRTLADAADELCVVIVAADVEIDMF